MFISFPPAEERAIRQMFVVGEWSKKRRTGESGIRRLLRRYGRIADAPEGAWPIVLRKGWPVADANSLPMLTGIGSDGSSRGTGGDEHFVVAICASAVANALTTQRKKVIKALRGGLTLAISSSTTSAAKVHPSTLSTTRPKGTN